jgi:hypothetical protein
MFRRIIRGPRMREEAGTVGGLFNDITVEEEEEEDFGTSRYLKIF